MADIKYKVIGRYMEGVRVIGYIVINSLNIKEYKTKDELYELALNKSVVNCSAQIYNDKIIVKGIGCQLTKLPKFNRRGEVIKSEAEEVDVRASIVGKLTYKKEVVGYRLQYVDNTNKVNYKDVSREKLLKLARNKKIANARVQMLNDKMLLRGVNCDLTKLPSLEHY